MLYTPPKSCPICENAALVSGNHKCQDYYDNLQQYSTFTVSETFQPIALTRKIQPIAESQEIEDMEKESGTIQISLKLIMQIYAQLSFLESDELAQQLLEEATGQSVTTRGK